MTAHGFQPAARLDVVPVVGEVGQAGTVLLGSDDPVIALDALNAVELL